MLQSLRTGATFALDSNAVWDTRLLGLADLINRVDSIGAGPPVRLVIPALVHGEHLVQEREKRPQFDLRLPLQTLADKRVTVVSYEQHDAEHFSEWLHEQFPTRQQRHQGRWLRLLGGEANLPDRPCPATNDWHISAQAVGRNWICVSDDTGPEFQGVDRKVNTTQLRAALEKFLQEPPSSAVQPAK